MIQIWEEIGLNAGLSSMLKTTLFLLLTLPLIFTGATADPQSGLPGRIVHKQSGITLILIPAGEFKMGSPENEPDRGRGERQLE